MPTSSSSDPRDTPIAFLFLLIGQALVVAGVALWSMAAALVVAGLMTMVAAVAIATLQEAAQTRRRLSGLPMNGTTSQAEEALK